MVLGNDPTLHIRAMVTLRYTGTSSMCFPYLDYSLRMDFPFLILRVPVRVVYC